MNALNAVPPASRTPFFCIDFPVQPLIIRPVEQPMHLKSKHRGERTCQRHPSGQSADDEKRNDKRYDPYNQHRIKEQSRLVVEEAE